MKTYIKNHSLEGYLAIHRGAAWRGLTSNPIDVSRAARSELPTANSPAIASLHALWAAARGTLYYRSSITPRHQDAETGIQFVAGGLSIGDQQDDSFPSKVFALRLENHGSFESSALDSISPHSYSPTAMFYRIRAVALLAVMVVTSLCGGVTSLRGAEPALAPREGVLLLKNGHVMQGSITKAGDYFVLTLGKTGEVRLPAADVETQCVDLEDAYRYQAALLSSKKAEPHLTLAEWCLRYGLRQQAEDQVAFARKLEGEHAKIAQLELRLKTAAAAPAPSGPKPESSSTTVGVKQLEESLAELPQGSMERFSVVIQPMLINRCGANGCHGPAAKSNFHLLRPSAGQMMSKRFTQRNLFTVLKYIDKINPEESLLVTMPQEKHGGMLENMFDKRTQQQLDDLVAWAKLTVPNSPPVALPTTIGPAQTLLTQQETSEKTGDRIPPNIAPMNAGENSDRGKPRSPRAPSVNDLKREGSGDEPTAPRDPFDPQIFNQKYLPAKN
jgi:hypothetical protein